MLISGRDIGGGGASITKAYASIVMSNTGTDYEQEIGDTFVTLTGWDTAYSEMNAESDIGNSRLKTLVSGLFLVLFHVSFTSDTPGTVFEFNVFSGTAGAEIRRTHLSTEDKNVTGVGIDACSLHGVLSLTANDVIQIRCKANSLDGINIHSAGLSMVRL